MFRSSGHRARSLCCNLCCGGFICCTGMRISRQRRVRDCSRCSASSLLGDEFTFTPIPFCEDLGGGCAAQDTRVNQTCEFDARDVPGCAVYTLKIPDCFCPALISAFFFFFSVRMMKGYLRMRINLIQKPAPILFMKNTRKPPRLVFKGLHILDFDA